MKWTPGLGIVSCLSLALASTTALLADTGAAAADSGFRCGTGRLVDKGDHMHEVRAKCGEPDAVTRRMEKRTIKHKVRRWVGTESEEITEEREIEVALDEWVYDLGDRRFIRYVAFENDRVYDVVTGSRGKRR